MPTVTVYRHGGTSGQGNPDATPPERSECRGWSASAIRRNTLFLYSVDETRLEGLNGCAFTLTVRDCPATAAEWGRSRDAFLAALRRLGVHLVHWVTEWQRRGVPHLHLAAYWSPRVEVPTAQVLAHWIRITAPWNSQVSGQHASPIWDVLGWNQYTSKHAARGLHHYQRNPAGIPEGWRQGSTGRMWGKLGPWPVQPPLKVELTAAAFYAYRRMVRSWRVADARSSRRQVRDANGRTVRVPDARRIRSARGMLRCPLPKLSAVRGVSEWLPESLNLAMLANLSGRGFNLESV